MTPAVLALGATTALLLLGVIQGATEFLPVSSSGHLVVFGHWFGLETEGNLSREIALHFGTLVAVVMFCFADLRRMLGAGSAGLWRLVVGATGVTGVLGLSLKDVLETKLANPTSAGVFLLGTTLLLCVVAPKDDERQSRRIEDGTWKDALVLGLFQSLALLPGISRAGSTLVGALLLGYLRPDAVRVAFLISIPAVGGAVLLDAVEGDVLEVAFQGDMLVAMGLACVVGTAALRFIAVRVDPVSLRRFGYYTAVLGVTALLTA